MLDQRGVEYRYREYTREPLSAEEVERALRLLGVEPSEVLRRRDPAFKALGLSGDEARERLIAAIAEHPTLLQRPIGICGERAVVGRPPERLLELVD